MTTAGRSAGHRSCGGDVLVTVVVAPEERRAAARALREAGAASVRSEETAESP
ncbi:MAG TPA: hypothetical protein VMJ92_02065 [Candidatus Limnocylindrales bacterium]|nr:hypothetical protein [Candidatus Limnocylindrales bacterium]